MGPTLKSVLYKGDFSMYLDIILVPYFRLSSIFPLLSLLYTLLLFSLSSNFDRLQYDGRRLRIRRVLRRLRTLFGLRYFTYTFLSFFS